MKGTNTDEYTDMIETVKEKMNDIVDMAAEGNTLENLRQKSDGFELFDTYTLQHRTIGDITHLP